MIRLKELRSQRGLYQKDVAKALNLSVQVYCNYENGMREPAYDTLIKLADFYNVSIDYLIGRSDLTPEEYAEGLRETKPLSITADEEELLDLYRDVLKARGPAIHDIIMTLLEAIKGN